MKNRFVFLFLFIIFFNILYSQTAQEASWSKCDYSFNVRDRIEDWLNKSFNEAKKAIKKGREYNGKHHKLPTCKIQEIESIYKNLIFEYDCSACGGCGKGGTSHHIAKGRPFVRICNPFAMYWDNRNIDLNKPPNKVCGCIQGLIVHELVHASGDHSEEGAVDCSRILYPCADDAWRDATPDHSNCNCCDQKGD